MIKCDINNKKEILSYIGKDYGKCLYLYVDLMKYGFDNPNVNLWLQKDDDGETHALVLQYYSGMHVFSRDGEFDAEEIRKLIEERDPSMVCGMKTTLDRFADSVPGYEMEVGKVAQLVKPAAYDTTDCLRASREDIRDIADLLADDEALGKPYKDDQLYNQLIERFDQKFGRSFLIRSEETGKVIATASTYAEEAGVAVISGVMVHPDYRGLGLAKKVLTAICRNLKEEGFDVFSYYYIPSAETIHIRAGLEPIGEWAKLVRKQ